MIDLKEQLYQFIQSPLDPIENFKLGVVYETIGQTAGASSFYLRAAEKTLDPKLQYCALIRNALCFEKQGKRDLTVKTLLQRAISLIPNRPEGYFFLSKLYENRKEFHDCYCTASIGLKQVNDEVDPRLPEYPGAFALLFQQAIGGWWVGLNEESRDILYDLYFNWALPDNYRTLVSNNLQNLGFPKRKLVYTESYKGFLRYKFPGLENVRQNYSQVFQDLFVLTVLNGKTGGTYLEIGAADPFYNNNTALLETVFNWTGVSLEIQEHEVQAFKEKRKNPILLVDATTVDYQKLLDEYKFPALVDYLQVDCDPASISFDILQKVLNTDRRFRVITFEHDAYADPSVREPSRTFLKSKGYELRVPNVAFNPKNAFEDWWVYPSTAIPCFRDVSDREINFAMDLFFQITK